MTVIELANQPPSFSWPTLHSINWHLTPSLSGTTILTLNGSLRTGWLGKLSSFLLRNEINIIGGTARKNGSLYWNASLEIETGQETLSKLAGFSPETVLCDFEIPLATVPIKLSDFRAEYTSKHGGSFYVEATGEDCMGFLHGILRAFSFSSMFPTEFEITTKGNTVFDRFWLKGIGASIPIKDDMKSLHERLHVMLGTI